MDRAQVHLRLLEMNLHRETAERVLRSISEAIEQSFLRMDVGDADELYVDAVQDEEADVLENLLGAAFVVLQARITATVSRVKALHKQLENAGTPLPTQRTSKEKLLKECSSSVGGFGCTYVEGINGVANYYKHNDEWHGDWDKLSGQSKKTAMLVGILGLSPGSTGNMRSGLRALTHDQDLTNLQPLLEAIDDWTSRLHEKLTDEVARL